MRRIIIIALAAAIPPLSARAGTPFGDGSEERQLSAIFDAGGIGIAQELETAPVPSAVTPYASMSIEEICRGQQLCFLDGHTPVPQSRQKLSPFWQDFLNNNDNYGQELNKKEAAEVAEGLENLNKTFIGSKVCLALSGGYCSRETLAAKNIIIRAEFLKDDFPAVTRLVSGKVVIVINRNAKYDPINGLNWAPTLAHELSHAEDYKKFKSGMTEPHRWDTETKAYLYSLQSYHELKTRYPRKIKNPVTDFFIQAWDWKVNGAAYPENFKVDGKKHDAAAFIARYLDPAAGGIELIRNAVKNFFYEDHTMTINFSSEDTIHWEFCRDIIVRAKTYNKWLKNPLLYNPPGQPGSGGGSPANHPGGHVPPGEGSGSGGTWNPPPIHPPDFGDGTGLDHPDSGNL